MTQLADVASDLAYNWSFLMIRSHFSVLSRSLAAVAIVSGLLGLGGCVSEDQYQRLQTAFDQVKQQLAASENDVARLHNEIAALQAEIAQKDALLSAQGGGTAALLKERDLLKARLAKLQAEYNKLLALAGSAPRLPRAVNDALEQLAEQYPSLLAFNRKLGLVRFKSDLTFALGSTEVRPSARQALAKFANILDMPQISDNEIRIVGNTDNVPIRRTKNTMNPSNWYLSTNRAISVMYVLQRFGVMDRRMQVAGWGKTHPIAPNAPGHRGSSANRRVDIFILPIKLKYNPYVPASEQVAPANGAGLAPSAVPDVVPAAGN